jgi:hypothetical protein
VANRDLHKPQWSCNRTFTEPQGVIFGTFGGFGIDVLHLFMFNLIFIIVVKHKQMKNINPETPKSTENDPLGLLKGPIGAPQQFMQPDPCFFFV